MRFKGPSKDLDYVEIGTDGTNIFEVQSNESIYEAAIKSGRAVQNKATATVTRGPLPKALSHPHAAILWFTFASQDFLRNAGTNQLPPLMFAEGLSDILLYFDFRQKADLEPWSAADPRPRRAVWLNDGVIRSWDKRDHAKVAKHWERRRKPPYDVGYTNAILEITQPKKIGNFSLGTRLDYWVFTTKLNGQTNTDLSLLQHHWLAITNVTLGTARRQFVPVPPEGITHVADERFAVNEGNWVSVNYSQTNGWLKDEHALMLLVHATNSPTEKLLRRVLTKDAASEE